MEKIEEIISFIDSHEKKETKNLLLKYLKKWPWFILFCTLGILMGYFYTKHSPAKFLVNSRILIINEESSMSSILSFDNPMLDFGKNKNIENQIGILRSYTLYRKAISNLDWDYSWYLKQPLYNADLYLNDPFELIIPPNGINISDIFID